MQHFSAVTEEDGDRNAPNALTRDAPVRASGYHVADAFLTPCRIPLDVVADLIESDAAERAASDGAIHLDEPLFGGAEDDWIVAAPAMRIGVLERSETEE